MALLRVLIIFLSSVRERHIVGERRLRFIPHVNEYVMW